MQAKWEEMFGEKDEAVGKVKVKKQRKKTVRRKVESGKKKDAKVKKPVENQKKSL